MAVRNLKDGNKLPWLCECYPQGRKGKRIRKRFATKGEALAFEKYTMQEVEDKPWLGEKIEQRRLLEMITLWHHRHGISLTDAKYTYKNTAIFSDYKVVTDIHNIELYRGLLIKQENITL